MKRSFYAVCASLMLFLLGAASEARAVACVAVPTYSANSETMAGVGLRFDFGDMNPEIVGVVRHTHANTSNTVVGVQGEIAIPLMKNGSFAPTIRAMGLAGKPSVLGQAGAGYDFGSQQPFVGIGVQGPYVEGGLDVGLDGTFNPYLGVNSLDEAAKRKKKNVAPPP